MVLSPNYSSSQLSLSSLRVIIALISTVQRLLIISGPNKNRGHYIEIGVYYDLCRTLSVNDKSVACDETLKSLSWFLQPLLSFQSDSID